MDRYTFRHSFCILIATEAPGMCLREVLNIGRQGLVSCLVLSSEHTSYQFMKMQDHFPDLAVIEESKHTLETLELQFLFLCSLFSTLFHLLSISLLSAIRFRW